MKTIAIILLLILILLIYNHIQISKLYINKPIFRNNKLSKELRITQISDYHANHRIDENNLLDEIRKFNPHIILLTGDIIDSGTKDIQPTVKLMGKMTKINKNIFFVSGNHEVGSKYGNEFIYKLKELGIIVLDNDKEIIDIEGESINICGVGFYINRGDYEEAIEGIDENNLTLVLSHSPNRPMVYSTGVEDLILSGHTHGGQVRLPLIGSVIVPGQGFFPKYSKGHYELGNTILYIDSGLGNSVLPIRLFNRVQISNIIVKPIDN